MRSINDVAYDVLKSIMIESKSGCEVHYHKSLVIQKIVNKYIAGLDECLKDVIFPSGVVILRFKKSVEKYLDKEQMLSYLISKGAIIE